MRKNKYTCDICGDDIGPIRRPIHLPGGSSVTSAHESIHQITLSQVDVDNHNYILKNEQLSKTYDVCEDCWDAVMKSLKNRKET